MSLYDILLDDFLSKSRGKLDREKIDEMITFASVAENLPKWRVLITFGQVYSAYVGFEESMHMLESEKASVSENEFIKQQIVKLVNE